jgi:hypothetical protein
MTRHQIVAAEISPARGKAHLRFAADVVEYPDQVNLHNRRRYDAAGDIYGKHSAFPFLFQLASSGCLVRVSPIMTLPQTVKFDSHSLQKSLIFSLTMLSTNNISMIMYSVFIIE